MDDTNKPPESHTPQPNLVKLRGLPPVTPPPPPPAQQKAALGVPELLRMLIDRIDLTRRELHARLDAQEHNFAVMQSCFEEVGNQLTTQTNALMWVVQAVRNGIQVADSYKQQEAPQPTVDD